MKVDKLTNLLNMSNADLDRIERKAEFYYHDFLEKLLLNDLKKGHSSFDEETVSELIIRMGTNWKRAYKKAIQLHHTLRAYAVSDKEFINRYQTYLDKWLKEAIIIGRYPKISFVEWFKKKYPSVELPKTIKPKVEID